MFRPMAAFARFSTGVKMFVILSAALLPLGLIALFASMESARNNRLAREAETRIVAADAARQINAAIARGVLVLQAVGSAESTDPGVCGPQLSARLSMEPRHMALALFNSRGRLICSTPGFSGMPSQAPERRIGMEASLIADPAMLRYMVGLPDGRFGVGELSSNSLAGLIRGPRNEAGIGASLVQGTASLLLAPVAASGLQQRIDVSVPLAGNQLAIEVSAVANPIGAIEALMVVLPIVMWLAAALIGWLVVDRLLVGPLKQMQSAIVAYGLRGTAMSRLRLSTPSTEIKELSDAFVDVTRRLSLHDAELEAALARQTRLTREVHHRVKNNLQVVASLINIHARGAKDADVAAAYASIQRRVDALAVVHRNHFAELEENRGVRVISLIGELASNLRATAPPEASHLGITLDLMQAHISQDVAVPISFLITELFELAMLCDPEGTIAISVKPVEDAGRATLTVRSQGLGSEACRDLTEMVRSRRIMEGLSRQLRARLNIDDAVGAYAIEISLMPVDPPAESRGD